MNRAGNDGPLAGPETVDRRRVRPEFRPKLNGERVLGVALPAVDEEGVDSAALVFFTG